jgi:hypothetical protein
MVGFHRVPGLGALVKSAQSSCWRCNGISKLYGIQAGCDLRFQFQGCPNLTQIDYQPQAGVNLCTFIQRLKEKQIWFLCVYYIHFMTQISLAAEDLEQPWIQHNSAIAMHLHAFTVYSVALNGRSSILHCHLVLLSFAPSRSRQPGKSKTA